MEGFDAKFDFVKAVEVTSCERCKMRAYVQFQGREL